MNQSVWRPVAPRALIVAAVCWGAWEIGVRPLDGRLASARAELARAEQNATDTSAPPPVAMNPDEAARISERLAAFGLLPGPASAQSIYDQLMIFALATGVRVERISPAQVNEHAPKADQTLHVARADAIVECTGTYDAVQRFVRAIENDDPSLMVVSMRLTPTADSRGVPAVAANIRVSKFRAARPAQTTPEPTP